MAKVKAQVSEVKGIMMENIEKVSSIFLLFLLTCLYVCKYIYVCVSQQAISIETMFKLCAGRFVDFTFYTHASFVKCRATKH